MNEYLIPLSEVVNDEQLLDFAMSHVCERNMDEIHPVAEQIVLRYILNEWAEAGKIQFSEDEVTKKYQEMIADYVLESLTKKGFVDTTFDDNGEILFSLSEVGKQRVQGIINDD